MLSVRYFYFVYQPAGLTPFGRHVGCEYTPGGCTYREVGSALSVLRMCTAGVYSTTSSAFRISPFIRSVRILVKRRKNFDDPTYLDN